MNAEWLVIQEVVGLNRMDKAIFFSQFPIPTPSVANGKKLVVPPMGLESGHEPKRRKEGHLETDFSPPRYHLIQLVPNTVTETTVSSDHAQSQW